MQPTNTEQSVQRDAESEDRPARGERGGTERRGQQRDEQRRLGMDEVFGVLKAERRRFVLRYLHSANRAVTIGELAEALAERESDAETYNHQDRKRMYVSLYQAHLPKMDDLGIVEWDSREGAVRLTEAFEQVEPYLFDRRNPPLRWHRAYLGAGLLGIVVVGSAQLWWSSVLSTPGAFLFSGLLGFYGALLGVRLLFHLKERTGANDAPAASLDG